MPESYYARSLTPTFSFTIFGDSHREKQNQIQNRNISFPLTYSFPKKREECNGSLTVHLETAETLSLLGSSWQATRQMHVTDPYLDRLETDLQSVPNRHSHVNIPL
jgi:hypothetical protein